MAFDEVYPFLQSQRRGFDFKSTGEDPKILSLVLYGQKKVLTHFNKSGLIFFVLFIA